MRFSWDTLADDARAAAEPLDGPRGAALSRAAQAADAWVLAGTVPDDGGDLFNTAVLYGPDGRLAARAPQGAAVHAARRGSRLLGGRRALTVVLHPELGPVGIATCFDGDFPEVARTCAGPERGRAAPVGLRGRGRAVVGRAVSRQRPRHGQWWISVNQCGATPSGTLLGASRVISPLGVVVAEAGRVAEGADAPAEELVVELDFAAALTRWDETCAALVPGGASAPTIRVIHVA